MIIDLILDRRDGSPYNPISFYKDCKDYEDTFNFGFSISDEMENGIEQFVKLLICRYIMENGYDPEICDYINSVNWL